jgi:murein DD-endopeptidase MepM/ murein hydrolase activator NlpD
MAVDETRFIRGDEARRLREPGQSIIENPGVLERAREVEEGIPAPSPVVDNTPTADGDTPADTRDAARRDAEAEIDRNPPEEGDQGRSPDPRVSADEAGTGSGATFPQEGSDARREQPQPDAEREARPAARPFPPHFFAELEHQAFYHDIILYIEGQEVSDYLVGTLSVTYGLGSSPNKCEFKLDNAGHKFTLTPENLQEELFRTPEQTRGLGNAFDYAETAKKAIFDRKKDVGHNPVDPVSGGRRLPLHHWSTIFHKNDSIRAWIHNPASERDEWIPVFTGYVVNAPISEDYITGENTISVTCQDIRYLMQKMRVNTNSVLAVLPGQQATTAADPTNTQPFTGLRIFQPQSNQQFNRSFFVDLIATSMYDNPWSVLSFRGLVAALTFLDNSQDLVRAQEGTVTARINASRQQDIRQLGRDISSLAQRVDRDGESSLSESELARYNRLKNDLLQRGSTVEQAISGTAPDLPEAGSVSETPASAGAGSSSPSVTSGGPADPPGTGDSGGPGGGTGGAAEAQRIERAAAPPRGAGRIGRFRRGVFTLRTRVDGSIYPPQGSSATTIQSFWLNWYNLCLFGSPERIEIEETTFAPTNHGRRRATPIEVRDGPLNHAIEKRRYWREHEVHQAGAGTKREGLWQSDTQAVHMIMPSRRAPTADLIFRARIIDQSNVSQNLNWTNRLSLLSDACDRVDYRFWVSGTGDLIFEFAQYDFDPRDYGPYQEVLTLDHHLLNESFDEEGGEVITAVVANGSYVGLENVPDGQLTEFIPVSVGVWSPNLASRHGLNVRVKNYPQIVSRVRLNRLAMLEFQKMLAAADEYQIGVAFRPWLLLNKPIFNKYRERYALIDGIRWVLPITAGSVAGQNVPTCSLTLNYSRSLDEIGIPRFITGGPSQPMYYGERRGNTDSIVAAIARRTSTLRDAINQLRSSSTPVTVEQIRSLREQYSALIPESQSIHNVIDAALQPSDYEGRPAGEESSTSRALRSGSRQLQELDENAGSFSQEERDRRLRSINESVAEAEEAVREEGQDPGPQQDPDGFTRPDSGRSGVRSTIEPSEEPERAREGPPSEDDPCNPGNPDMFSSPVGRQQLVSVPIISRWNQRIRSLGTRRAREARLAFAHGRLQDPFRDISPTGIWQEQGDFPRTIISGFGWRPRGWAHKGADFPMRFEEPVYAVADGIVIASKDSGPISVRGMPPGDAVNGTIRILHKGGFVTFYRHLLGRLVNPGDLVKRNEQIATIGSASNNENPAALIGTHLHFETAVVSGSPPWDRWVGRDKRWRVLRGFSRRQILRRAGVSDDASNAEKRRALEAGSPQNPRDLGSTRVIGEYYQGARGISTISGELRDRFDLGFLRERRGEFRIPTTHLHYSPACLAADPFNGIQRRTSGDTTRTGSGKDPESSINLVTQEEYFQAHGLKGVPSVGKRKILASSFTPPEEVPPLPPEGTAPREADRINRNRQAIISQNETRAARLTASRASYDAQVDLFRGTPPPEECPPERYEGTVPRQAGEPLPEQTRITRSEAEAAYRPREGTSGEGS